MNKADFLTAVAEKAGVSKKDAASVVAAFEDVVVDLVKKDDKLTLTGFLSFERKTIPAKSGKIPGTDKTYSNPETVGPRVKIGKSFKDSVAS